MRSRRKSGRCPERFARIPLSVLTSEAVTTLNHAHLRVLLILATQYSGSNNGTMACTPLYARQFGFRGHDTVYKALRELEARGLIVRTRMGIKQRDVFSLYALGWEDVDSRDGKPLAKPEPRNNARWLQWRQSTSTSTASRAVVPSSPPATPSV